MRVELVLTAREPEDWTGQPPRLGEHHLRRQTSNDEHWYLDSMIEQGLLALVTVNRFETADDAAVAAS